MQNQPCKNLLEPILLERCIRHIIHRSQMAEKATSERWHAGQKRLFASDVQRGDPRAQIIGEGGLGLDSLARISAATAVARFFDLGASGRDDYLYFEETLAGWSDLVAQHLSEHGLDTDLVFETSGSTDIPKPVRKRLSDLWEEAAAVRAEILPPHTNRVIALVPPHHLFGFIFTVLVPQLLGVGVHEALYRGSQSVLRNLEPGDLVVGTPFVWASLLNAGQHFPEGVCGVSSAGALSPTSWNGLAELGLTEMREVFGSTETGGLAWRRNPDDTFFLLPHLRRRGDGIAALSTGLPLPLQDRIVWRGDRRFIPEGRVDRAVKVGGTTVSLERVRRTLCSLDVVADAAVRMSGERLKAFIVPADSALCLEALSERLAAQAQVALDPAARPVAYDFGPELPRNEMGKLSDW